MNLPDKQLNPPSEEYCEVHDCWYEGRCQECLADAADDRAEWELERRTRS